MKRHVLLTALLMVAVSANAAVPTWAATYYVATTGSDGNSCAQAQTIGTPKLTIAAGAGCLTANNGDTLTIRNGTYVESMLNIVPTGNSWANATTVKAENARQAIVKPSSGFFALEVTGTSKKYIIFDGLVFDGTNLTNSVVKIDGNVSIGFPDHTRYNNVEVKNGVSGSGWQITSDGAAVDKGGFNEILNCSVHDNGNNANDANLYIQNGDNLVQGCDFYGALGAGVTNNKQNSAFPDRNIYRKNKIHDNGVNRFGTGKGIGLALTSHTGVQVINNLIYNNTGTIGQGINTDTNSTVNSLIYNNTIYGNSGSGISLGGSTSGNVVRNNIVFNNTGGGITNSGSNTIDTNTTSNPSFVNAAVGDFHLLAGSVAINAGLTLSEVPTDFDGVLRPQGSAYDIGAYEYGVLLGADRVIDFSYVGTKLDFTTRTTPCLTLNPVGGNNATQITNALTTCAGTAGNPKLVLLNAGDYPISTKITWGSHSYVTLRGVGETATTITGGAGMSCPGGQSGAMIDAGTGRSANYYQFNGAQRVLTANTAIGATSVTTTANHGWAVGDYVLMAQTNDGAASPPWVNIGMSFADSPFSGTRLKSQVVRILTTPTATSATFTPPTYWSYAAASTVLLSDTTDPIKGISIENLTLDNRTSLCGSFFYSYGIYNSLFQNVTMRGFPNQAGGSAFVHIADAAENTFRRITMKEGSAYQTNAAYSIWLDYFASNNLVEDSIFSDNPLFIAPQGPANGNVFGYNYWTRIHWGPGSTCAPGDCPGRMGIATHGAANMNLWEGNYSDGQAWCDSGNFNVSQHYGILLRNAIDRNLTVISPTGPVAPTYFKSVVDIEFRCYNWSLIGNVIGALSIPTVYDVVAPGQNSSGSTVELYRVGYATAFNGTGSAGSAGPGNTLVRHGNWTPITAGGGLAGVTWETTNTNVVDFTNHTIPNSYYLASKPAFFGSCTWPWIDPLGVTPTTRILTLPAKDRYDGGTACAGGSDITPPQAPQNPYIVRPPSLADLYLVSGGPR